MKNVVSIETAKALRDAGFPQPKPEPGQFWYDYTKRLFVIAAVGTTSITGMWIERGTAFQSKMNEFDIFAPTATDILEQLGYDEKKGLEFSMQLCDRGSGNKWTVRSHNFNTGLLIQTSENPAEAAAQMWLAANQK